MKVYKFGGGVLTSADSIRELGRLVRSETAPLVVVVSAFGKTTSALEAILDDRMAGEAYLPGLDRLCASFRLMIDQLLCDTREDALVALRAWRERLLVALELPAEGEGVYKMYSAVVAEGELLTSELIAFHWREIGVPFTWLDIRSCIKTRDGFCSARVNWPATDGLVRDSISSALNKDRVVLTQGFIGSNELGETTTLGKEGSDFTAALLAALLAAESLTIWKDVLGVMSGDPKLFKDVVKFDRLSYDIVGKMAAYGARAIHSKTIFPLSRYHIPLYVRSFGRYDEPGTVVINDALDPEVPIYIVKEGQSLLRLDTGSSSWLDEGCMDRVWNCLRRNAVEVPLLEQMDRTEWIMCLSVNEYQMEALRRELSREFEEVEFQCGVSLLTVFCGDGGLPMSWLEGKRILFSKSGTGLYQAVFAG